MTSRIASRSRKRAFTLMEILVVLVIAGVLFSMFYVIFLNGWFDFELSNERVAIQTQALRAMQNIEEDVFEAESLSVAEDGQMVTFQYPRSGYLWAANSLIPLHDRPLTKDPFPFASVEYRIINGDLQRTAGDGAPVLVTRGGYIDAASRFIFRSKEQKSLQCLLNFRSAAAFGREVDYQIYNVFQSRN